MTLTSLGPDDRRHLVLHRKQQGSDNGKRSEVFKLMHEKLRQSFFELFGRGVVTIIQQISGIRKPLPASIGVPHQQPSPLRGTQQ